MQTALLVISLFGFNWGIVEYRDASDSPVYLLCVDDGREGVCLNSEGEVESAYDCGPAGCAGF